MCTLSCLQMHPFSMVVVDEDATLELQVKTVKVHLFGVEQLSEVWIMVLTEYSVLQEH